MKTVFKFLILILLQNVLLSSANGEESSKLKFGKPLNIVDFNEKLNSVFINYDAIDQLLIQPDVKDRKIVVVSVVGSGEGKSVFLDYCLKFLYSNVRLESSMKQFSKQLSINKKSFTRNSIVQFKNAIVPYL